MDNELKELRGELDRIDKEIIRLFEERMETAGRIGAVKRLNGLEITDPAREEEVVSSRIEALPEKLREGGERLMRLLIDESKKIQRAGQNIYLIGMPDSGKTRMGKKLKDMLSMPLLDTDKLIMEKTCMSIDSIFRALGEECFRDMETALLKNIVKRGGFIVAAGGGLPLREENARLMRGSGTVVFLDRALDRLHGQNTKNRPLIAGETEAEVNANIDRLYHERYDKYLACAHITVDPDEEDSAERIAARLRE